jgi:uncharacterized protein YcfJ
MRMIVTVACLVALNAPLVAHAQSGCEARARDRRVAGTVLGAVGGAVIGNQISHSGGTIVGGLVGGFAGNQLSKTHCPHYTRTSRTRAERRYTPASNTQEAQASISARCSVQDQPFYDAHGDLVHHQVQVCR